jgi:hypothetical protein
MYFPIPLIILLTFVIATPLSAPAVSVTTFLTENPVWPSRRRGVAFNQPSLVKHFDTERTKTKWCFNWDSRSGPTNTWFEFVPMLHNNRPDRTGRWLDDVKAAAGVIRGNPTHLLGFNEPDNCQ